MVTIYELCDVIQHMYLGVLLRVLNGTHFTCSDPRIFIDSTLVWTF